MSKSKKLFGEKIEKNIRYCEEIDTYYVQFNFSPTNETHLRSFPTLEDARKYRDKINEEKLIYKLSKDLAVIQAKEIEEIKKCVPYPYNAFEATHLKIGEVDSFFVDSFDKIIDEICNEREARYVRDFFSNYYTLQRIGKKEGVTRERVRQVISKAMKKFENYVYSYAAKQKIERDFADRHAFRAQLIEEYKKNGVITPEMNFEFGELRIGNYYASTATIDDLDLSIRSYNCLKKAGIKYLCELTKYSENDLLKLKRTGKKSVKEIRSKLLALGLDLAA